MPQMIRLFDYLYSDFVEKGYFQEAFGYNCVDAGEVPGKVGNDINVYFILKLRKDNLWPIRDKCVGYDESDLFDVIEFLYDHMSKPIKGTLHTYNDCGWHYYSFNKDSGKIEYRTKINELLRDYSEGYELSAGGEVLHIAKQCF
jgi:hypothetical protein